MFKKYLIIGSSAGGIGCALRLRMLDQEAEITVLTAENEYPYNKCLLTDVLLGERNSEESIFCSPALLAEKRINFIPNTLVNNIDVTRQQVMSADGHAFYYDALCIATGRSPRILPLFSGKKFNNFFNFYYKKQIDQIIEYVTTYKPCHAVVIGAGLTGLEAADGLSARGCQVTMIESASQILPNLVTMQGAQVIHEQMHQVGVQLLVNDCVIGYDEVVDDHIVALKTEKNGTIPADIVICAIGAEPNTNFLPEVIERTNGYCIVDETLCTSVPHNIYAVGDCCMIFDRLQQKSVPSSLWPDAMQQGMYAAYNMVGMQKIYPSMVQIAASGFFGLKIACAGPIQIAENCTMEEKQDTGWYHRFVYRDKNLIGFMLIGNMAELATYRRQVMSI